MDIKEDLQGLWVGQSSIDDSTATIETGESETGKPTTWSVRKSGEIMLRGHSEGGRFVLQEVLRIAFAGVVVGPVGAFEDDIKNPFGKITIVGPLPETTSGFKPVISQDDMSGKVTNLWLQVHYLQLSLDDIERGAYYRAKETEIRIPPTVRMKGDMTWNQVSIDEKSVRLSINFTFTDDTAFNDAQGIKNLVNTITLDKELEMEFFSVESALPDDSLDEFTEDGKVYRLCHRPNAPCSAGANEMLIRRIPIRFVCIFNATEAEKAELAVLCTEQIDGICEVWRGQAVLSAKVRIDVTPMVVFAGRLLSTENFADSQSNWNTLINLPAAEDPDVIDIFIVRRVSHNGAAIPGVSYDLTVVSAGVVLSLAALRNPAHKYLLAHELGHCLGLEHPGQVTTVGGTPLPEGSPNSVMQIINGHAPLENTADNCVIFGDSYHGLLNPLARVVIPLRKDCLRPLL